MTTPSDPSSPVDPPPGQGPGSYPPPQGGYPPPPPQGAGYPGEPYPGAGYPPPPPGGVNPYGGGPSYASWGTRVGAYLLDALVTIPPYVLGAVLGAAIGGGLGTLLIVIGAAGSLGLAIWNRWIRAGNTGQSLGKTWTSIYLVDEATGRPLGPGGAFLRDVLHILDGLCYIGYIMAAFDPKVQTFADKIKGSVVVRG